MKLPLNRVFYFFLSLILFTSALPVVAQLDEAAAVEQRCGAPKGEHEGISPVTNVLQRDLMYGDTTLHFVPSGGGWTFTTAWRGHLPVSGAELEMLMPCFSEAVTASAAQPAAGIDPTIATQTLAAPKVSTMGSIIPHLGLILFLLALVAVLAFWPRQPAGYRALPSAQRLRRPRVRLYPPARRHHPLTDV